MPTYRPLERISLKNHPELSERWIEQTIADNPAILGLGGELSLRDKQRSQPRAGRLDLLLEDSEEMKRYEVELQLGATDETHIIRTIEYWDIERKRSRNYDHCAVLIAEDITSRFLNVISLFNSTLPLIAIQVQALKVDDSTFTLVFSKILDERSWTPADDVEGERAPPADRGFWESRASKETVVLSEELLNLVRKHDPLLSLSYTRSYIGITRRGQPFNFAIFVPKQNFVRMRVWLPKSSEWDEKIADGKLEILPDGRDDSYRFRITKDDLANKAELLESLLKSALDERLT
jgi:hypothetical protein